MRFSQRHFASFCGIFAGLSIPFCCSFSTILFSFLQYFSILRHFCIKGVRKWCKKSHKNSAERLEKILRKGAQNGTRRTAKLHRKTCKDTVERSGKRRGKISKNSTEIFAKMLQKGNENGANFSNSTMGILETGDKVILGALVDDYGLEFLLWPEPKCYSNKLEKPRYEQPHDTLLYLLLLLCSGDTYNIQINNFHHSFTPPPPTPPVLFVTKISFFLQSIFLQNSSAKGQKQSPLSCTYLRSKKRSALSAPFVS